MRVWRYVITVDRGAAPNREPPMTTLTICKPRIRRQARKGDLVVAFNGAALNRDEPHAVRWAGLVSEVIPLKDYWRDVRFRGKKPEQHGGRRSGGFADNIYRPTFEGHLAQVANETHGSIDADTDTGGLNALVLEPAWHFGPAVAVLPERFGLRIAGGRRGHRLSEIDALTWRELEAWLDENKPGAGPQATAIDPEGRCTPSKEAAAPKTARHRQSKSATSPVKTAMLKDRSRGWH